LSGWSWFWFSPKFWVSRLAASNTHPYNLVNNVSSGLYGLIVALLMNSKSAQNVSC
jgi:hypothetical protein